MRLLDLFSGIGGFSLGLERAGFRTVAFCEIEPFCRAVLRKHWPEVPCYEDIRTLSADTLRRDGIAVDAICGGFPCQDLSHAGKRAGLEGERSGLWGEYRRLIGELRPRFVIVENVPGLLSLGMGTVLGDLAALGYDAVWDCIPASAVGAPHKRDRVWIVAHSISPVVKRTDVRAYGKKVCAEARRFAALSDGADVSNPISKRQQGQGQPLNPFNSTPGREGEAVDAFNGCVGGQWASEPDVGRVANGVPNRSHRLKALGNAVVPQVVEAIGRAVMEGLNAA
jgi:DNA (cytosine-5)-methyltransferase 1